MHYDIQLKTADIPPEPADGMAVAVVPEEPGKESEAEARWPDDFVLSLMRYARRGRLTLVSRIGETEQRRAAELRYLIVAALEQEDFEADGSSLSSPVCYAEWSAARMPGRALDKGSGRTDQE